MMPPFYDFEHGDGRRFEEFMSIDEYAARCRNGQMRLPTGEVAKRILTGVRIGGHHPSCWPMTSEAAGVSPEQIPEAMEHDRKMGVPTSYTKDGMAIYTDRRHRAKHLKAIGMVDRDGGYGD